MANIPVERSGGIPWWVWLLGLLALLLLGALLLSQCGDDADRTAVTVEQDGVSTAGDFDESAVADDAGAATAGVATAGALTSLAALRDAIDGATDGTGADGTTLDGRDVRLSGLAVSRVVGDSTFYVGTGDELMPVVLEELGESELGAGGTDGVFDVNEGDTVSINGRVRSYRAGMAGTGALSETDRSALDTRPYVLVVRPGDMTKQ